ncbi:MAG: phosphate ABC transporter permease PtsA, partial [Nevskia sp.]|nr:phosphate ABC transporter permease PtsA [Nevskia sp.]
MAQNLNMAIYHRRRLFNKALMALAWTAAVSGLAILGLILGTLLFRGVGGVSLDVFTQMTPPPGGEGGLLNAIYGSVAMTLLGTVLGTPVGVLAGTYMAEYGRNNWLTTIV